MQGKLSRYFLLAVALLFILAVSIQSSPVWADEPLPDKQVVNIAFKDAEELSMLADKYDVIEVDHTTGVLKAIVTDAERQRLQAAGIRWVVDIPYTVEINKTYGMLAGQTSGIPGFPCYRTIAEIFETGAALANNYPNLAEWKDIGDSWEKSVDPNDGYDMRVLVLGNRTNGNVVKSDIFIMSGIHAREWAPPELNTRFAEYLLSNYGVNADVTWLLDYNNIHLLLVTNPDGRTMDESNQSYLWRKNTNNNYCSNSLDRGADLNRNFPFKWQAYNYQCDETYPGPNKESEPEVTTVTTYVRSLFTDMRGPGDNDSVNPISATGLFIDLHSYSRLVLWPWGWTLSNSPNEAQLRTIGYKFAYYNGHDPKKSAALYYTNGTTEDWAYGELGLAGYCFEVGDTFHQQCSTFENDIYPNNQQALLRAVKMARNPYTLAYGPETYNLTAPTTPIDIGTTFEVKATIDDTRYSTFSGGIQTQYINEARYTIDAPSWTPGITKYAMIADAGDFDLKKVVNVTGVVDTTNLTTGQHILFVEGKDAQGKWGPPTAIYITISDVVITPEPTNTPEPPIITNTYLPIILSNND